MNQKRLLLAWLPVFFMAANACALYPYWSSGMLYLKFEGGELAKKTRVISTVIGVETFYREYRSIIEDFIDDGEAWAYLPGEGYCRVDAEKLASTCFNDPWLQLWDVYSSQAYNQMVDALRFDSSGLGTGTYYDPYSTWKWRSVYMENRYASNSDTRLRNANCWGTADYMARDFEWRDMYVDEFPNGASSWKDKFPNIYLEGGQRYYGGPVNPHCIDDDLDPNTNDRAVFQGRTSGVNPDPSVKPEELINSFDVVRLAEEPTGQPADYWELDPTGDDNVGENLHSLAYLCTDENGDVWMYEKANYGSTEYAPYGLRKLGTGDYAQNYRSFFKKYGDYKENLADSYDLNWAGITK